jgi:putative ABC transport system permease protein
MTPISTDKVKEIEKVAGVKAAAPMLGMLLDEEAPSVSMGPPPMIMAADASSDKYESFTTTVSKGRKLRAGDTGKVLVGSDLVKKLDAEVGGTIKLHGKTFEVIGILDKTLTAPDNEVFVSLEDGQKLFVKTLPAAVAATIDIDTLASQIVVYPEDGVNPETLAKTLRKKVDGIQATGPKTFQDQVVSATKLLSSIILGIALISLLVGGLSVVNTMTMAVSERTREIGVRKAIGATSGTIMRQFVAESGVIGMMGGLLGLGIGCLLAYVFNAAGNDSGTQLFLVTTRLALGSVSFALVLGILSGLYPAWHAARLNPVQALRYE